jgi:hypothetical protein
MNFFDLPHIFVVFHPGSGGNFIAGLCHKLINQQLGSIEVANTGSSHTQAEKKSTGTDFLAFTTISAQHAAFKSDSDRISYYIENIKKEYHNVSIPMVAWTHDFTNIPVYKEHFKNSKTLVITADSDRERLTAIIMNVIKVMMDPNLVIPLSLSEWENLMTEWKRRCKVFLEQSMSSNHADIVLADRFNPKYKNLLIYISIRLFLDYFKVNGLLDPTSDQKLGVFDNVLYASKDPMQGHQIGPPVNTFIDSSCEILPYSYLANNDIDMLTRAIASVMNRKLTLEESSFIASEFTKYRRAQDQVLLSDPVQYFKDLELNITQHKHELI